MTITTIQENMCVPNGWQVTTIGDVTEKFLNGGTPSTKNPEYWEGNIPWTTSSPMTSFYLDRGEYTISKEGLEKSASNLIPKNNVLISTRVGVGKVAINRIDVAINQDLTGLILDKTRIAPEFFVWTLLSKEYNQKLKGMSRGTTIKGLIRSELERFTIPLPPLSEQRHIATILITVDDAIQRSRQAAAETERLKAGVIQELMTKGIGHTEFKEDPDVGRVPKEWETGTITSLAEINPKCDVSHLTDESIVSFIPMQNVSEEGRIVSKESKKYSEVKNGFTCFHEGDILFAKITPCMENGKGALVTGLINKTGFGSTEFFVLRPQDAQSAEFLYQLSQSSSIRNRARSFMTGTAGQQRVSRAFFDLVKLPLPPLPEQRHIATILSTLDHKLSLQRKRTAHYEQLKQGLMNELLMGKRRVKVT